MSQSLSFAIGEVAIRQQNGLFSLNDLHRASGSEKRHQPGYFFANDQTKALVEEITNTGIPAIETRRGANGGTYACRELVIAYAAWISAAFHLKVIRVFLAVAAPQAEPTQARLDYDRISPAQAQDLKEIVTAIVQAGAQTYGETWARFQRKFRVNSYLELPATQHLEARAYLLGKLPKAGADNVVDEAPPLATDNEKVKRAFALASEVAQQAAVTVFNALIDDDDVHKHSRWMFSLSHNRLTNEQDVPWAKPIEHDKMLFSMKDLPRRIVEPNSMIGTREELANIAIACMQKLSGVGEMKMRQA